MTWAKFQAEAAQFNTDLVAYQKMRKDLLYDIYTLSKNVSNNKANLDNLKTQV